jgi:hypothetical protein
VSARGFRRALWALAFVAAPAPIVLLGPGHVPPAQLAELGTAALVFGLAESLRGVVGLTALIFLVEALVYGIALWVVAGLAARALGRFRVVALAVAAVLVGVACVVPIYRSPYHAVQPEVTLLEVYR